MSKARGLADLGNVYNDGALSNRNLIINGAMQVAQRGASATGKSDALYHTVDRFTNNTTTGAVWTYTQESDAPSGFSKSFKCEVTTANASPAISYYSVIQHRLEGQNLQSIAKGTSDANPVTVSFWVKSNVTGTYQFNLLDVDNTRLAGNTYSISSSGVWEYKTITIPADAVGVLVSGSQESLSAEWWLSSGTDWSSGAVPTTWEAMATTDRNAGSTVNLAGTIGNYFQITGVQLEVGDTATPFEHRSYGDELARCQRYCYRVDNSDAASAAARFGYGHAINVTSSRSIIPLPCTMRTKPTISTGGTFNVSDGVTGSDASAISLEAITSSNTTICLSITSSSLTAFRPYYLEGKSGSDEFIQMDAEL